MVGTSANRLILERDRGPIEAFVRFDRVAAVGGLLLLVFLNGVFVRRGPIWLIVPSIVVLIWALTVAGGRLDRGELVAPIVLLSLPNWLVAITAAAVLPFLWPIMVITVLMPVVLVTPYVDRRQLVAVVTGAALASLAVAVPGLLNDDGGAVPDIPDWAEFGLVIGALVALVIPCGLIVWLNNRVHLQELEALSRAQDELLGSRRRVVEAADRERARIERDLHDGAQQSLVAIGVRLRLLDSQTTDQPDLNGAVAEVLADAERAVEELRELANGIYPPILQSQGLAATLRSVARRSPVAVDTEIEEVGRLDPSVEHAIYFAALEALTNAAKHAPDAPVSVELARVDDVVRLVVADRGPGFDPAAVAHSRGTANMGDRLAAVGGELTVEAAPGRGTVVTGRVPVGPAGGRHPGTGVSGAPAQEKPAT